MLRVRRAVEDMRAIEKRVREDQGTPRVPVGAQDEVNFDVDRPGYDDSSTERREEAHGEVVPAPLSAIARGDERPGVTYDQPASRDSTSSIRSERSGSSSTTPAYGSSAGTCSTNSATSAENEVRLRLASRSSRLANDAGIEMVRRTAFMKSQYESMSMIESIHPTTWGSSGAALLAAAAPASRRAATSIGEPSVDTQTRSLMAGFGVSTEGTSCQSMPHTLGGSVPYGRRKTLRVLYENALPECGFLLGGVFNLEKPGALLGARLSAAWHSAVICVTMRHMKQVSLRELHEKTGSLIRDARRLGGLIITDRGAPIARIEPVDSRPAPNPFLSRRVLPAYQRLLRSGRLGRGTDSTQSVSDDRDGR